MNNKLVHTLHNEYNFTIISTKIIHDTSKSFVCRVDTDNGPFAVKSLYNQEHRQKFIIEAENYLRERGISIPKVMRTKSNKPFILHDGSPYLVQQWIHGKSLHINSKKKAIMIGALLGKTHLISIGFESKYGDQYSGSKHWMDEYQNDLLAIEDWSRINSNDNSTKIKLIQTYLPFFIETGLSAYQALLQNSFFQQWNAAPLSSQFLCHGDFHNNNVIIHGSSYSIIDWEDVRYDFPSKDLSRLLFIMMREDRKWQEKRWQEMFSSYLAQNPLNDHEKSLLFIDLTFPHMTERYLRKRLYEKKSYAEVFDFLEGEKNKTLYMHEQMKCY